MLYHLLYGLEADFPFFNVFRYITLRTSYAVITALVISFALGPWIIRSLSRGQIGQQIRDEGPKSHHSKAGTPTMGGVIVLVAVLGSALLWGDLGNPHVWLLIVSIVLFGLIGFLDDYLKVVRKHSEGLLPRYKFSAQVAVSLLIIGILIWGLDYSTRLSVPFFKNFQPDLGLFYIPFAVLVLVGASNAVNLTDGLDGLAIGPVIVATAAYTVFAYISGHRVIAEYLLIPYI
ncbi:MAG TPA: phospho-N-acetylmuramoyl-pentapeptide-transferase, partial [Nitrospiria bacterium]